MSEPSNEAIMTAYVYLGGEPDDIPQLTVDVIRLAKILDAFAARKVAEAVAVEREKSANAFHAECPNCGALVDVIPQSSVKVR